MDDPDEGFLPPSWQFQDIAPDDDQPDLAALTFWPVAERRQPDRLLIPLARAQDAVARLEASVEAASAAVAEGLRARVSLHEASGFLGHRHTTVHPRDLALHEAGLTGSYTAASILGTLANELPWSFGETMTQREAPTDWAVDQAMHFARLWRQLATMPPPRRADRWRAPLAVLASRDLTDEALAAWVDGLPAKTEMPGLLAAAEVVAAGQPTQARQDHLDLPATYVAAALWRLHGYGQSCALPFWSAPLSRVDALAQKTGLDFQLAYLDCVTEAALRARRDLAALQTVERKAGVLKAGGRSHLAGAVILALREPVVTARGLGEGIGVSTRSALDLLKRLVEEGLLREATGRATWRAFVIDR